MIYEQFDTFHIHLLKEGHFSVLTFKSEFKTWTYKLYFVTSTSFEASHGPI